MSQLTQAIVEIYLFLIIATLTVAATGVVLRAWTWRECWEIWRDAVLWRKRH